MKPMIALIVFGLGTLGVCAGIAFKNFDGVVETKTYEASLKYDQTVADMKSIENAVGKININKDGKITSILVEIDAAKTAYPEIALEGISIARPMGTAIPLKHSGGSFSTEKPVESGWYNVTVKMNAGGKNISIAKSVYIE